MARLAIFTERYTIRSSVELTALANFRLAAFERGHELDFLFKNELKYLKNYDGIFIRALTDPLNTSYVVARTAEMLGKRVLDHSDAILICCDKVNMYSRLSASGVPIPETRMLAEGDLSALTAARLFEELGTPLVLKAPNSSFSAYVDKVTSPEDFVRVGRRFLRRADRLVVQQYMPSEFDWRVIILAGKVLAVLRYQFAPEQWKAMGRSQEGQWATVVGVPREQAAARLIETALKAANSIGDSLYGVDLKEIDGEYYVIEVNDNPTIAAGEEDQADADIYDAIIRHLANDA
ncbi:MAG TPA: RimK family alpha-L-glutamate ligase [Trueperaceae bacterium]|nr:RimK family alpha-L-glutamate ligase [Trueperaceae bacterium]